MRLAFVTAGLAFTGAALAQGGQSAPGRCPATGTRTP
jgi:hypothetical protein